MVSLAIGGGTDKTNYKSAVSVDSTTMSFESGAGDLHLDIEAEQHKHMQRRRITILAIVAIFTIAASILIFSVVHDLTSRQEIDYVDFTCEPSDSQCIELFCPKGWQWSFEDSACNKLPDYECCVAQYEVPGEHIFNCWKSGEENPYRCVLNAGVAPSAYKQLCRPGYLWVPWKKKCQRKD
eukprot:TRINITY_DN37426_c1_g1_i1.p1 TRINITY_DN37426_c1_g1~~TRINITY_DN37426_c1_g1_i1.p1  ORF type:complete len:181 (-),score=46.88 TRINITY_DN37426_c1_g1_i1:281-823(-)